MSVRTWTPAGWYAGCECKVFQPVLINVFYHVRTNIMSLIDETVLHNASNTYSAYGKKN